MTHQLSAYCSWGARLHAAQVAAHGAEWGCASFLSCVPRVALVSCPLAAGKTAASCIGYLKENRVAELTFLPLDQLKVQQPACLPVLPALPAEQLDLSCCDLPTICIEDLPCLALP